MEFIFGRAILTCDTVINGIAKDAPTDAYQLWFPHLHTHDYTEEWHKSPTSYPSNGMLVLEATKNNANTAIKTLPFGVIVFTCSLQKRDIILREAEFTNEDIVAGHLQLRWLPQPMILLMEQSRQQVTHSWSTLWEVSLALALCPNPPSTPICTDNFELGRWSFVAKTKLWHSYHQDDDEDDTLPRSLRSNERAWAHFHISLRWACDRTLSPTLIAKALDATRVYNNYPNGIGAELAEDILTDYVKRVSHFQEACSIFKATVGKKMQAMRERFSPFSLYASCLMRKFTEESIKSTPTDIFNSDILSWCNERERNLIESFDNVFDSVYDKAKPVYIENAFLRLYGNFQGLSVDICQLTGDSDLPDPSFMVENLGCLSNPTRQPLPLYADHVKGHFPTREIDNVTTKRLIEAATYCTPVWAIPQGSSMDFMTLTPIFLKQGMKKKRRQITGTVDELIGDHMYPAHPQTAATHEYAQSGMHWSAYVADVDILPSLQPAPNTLDIAHDLVHSVNTVFNEVFGFLPRQHYVYASRSDGTSNKIGLHHHALMPVGIVLTPIACAELTLVLSMRRHAYPKTLGIQVSNDGIYDMAIYPRPGPKGHCLRGPLQTKANGSRKLECVYGDCEGGMPAKLIHGPQRDEEGKRVCFGRVVERIDGILDITDVPYLRRHEVRTVNDYVSSNCAWRTSDIMDAMNKRTFLFADTTDPTLLLQILNDLWEENGREMLVNHMTTERSEYGTVYKQQNINAAKKSRLIYHDNSATLVMGTSKTLPFCPVRAHRKQQAVSVHVVHNRIKFLIMSKCFKSSCQQTRVSPKVYLCMSDVFVTPPLALEMEAFFNLFKNPSTRMLSLVATDDGAMDVEYVVHEQKGVGIYIQKSFKLDVMDVYMFLEDVLVVRLSMGLYVACLMQPKMITCASVHHRLIIHYLLEKRLCPTDRVKALEATFAR